MVEDKRPTLPASDYSNLCVNDARLAGIEGSGSGCQLIDEKLGEAGAHNHGPDSRWSNSKILVV